jgi:haloalkane dehalogenase
MTIDWRSLYPFASHFLEVDGHRMHYVDEPLRSAGLAPREVLLLVHGNPTWSFYWRELIKVWRVRHRVIAVDHVGCGLSDKECPPYRLADRVGHLVHVIQRLDLRHITLVGHDWGGAIGLGAAEAVPQRFARLVLLNTGAFPPTSVPWRLRAARNRLWGPLAVQGLNLFLRAAMRMTTVRPNAITPPVRAGYLAPYAHWRQRRAIFQFVRDIPLSPSHPTYRTLADVENGLARLSSQPCLVLWGMQDWCFTPACLERMIGLMPWAEVHRLDGAGHWVVEDAGEIIALRVQEFMDAHPLHLE